MLVVCDGLELRVGHHKIDWLQGSRVWTHLSGHLLLDLVDHLGVSLLSILLIAIEVRVDELLGAQNLVLVLVKRIERAKDLVDVVLRA